MYAHTLVVTWQSDCATDGVVPGCPLQRALANHRNSVTLHDWSISSKGNDIHEILIVMQLYDGGTVLEMMNARLDRGFTEHEVLRIFTDVLLAVTRLHHRTKPIIHRDLKVGVLLLSTFTVLPPLPALPPPLSPPHLSPCSDREHHLLPAGSLCAV